MTTMIETTQVYNVFIRATPEQIWDAITKPEFTAQYFHGVHVRSTLEPGTPFAQFAGDGETVVMQGEVLESDPPRRLVLKWRNEFRPELKADGYTLCTFEVEREGEMVRLTVSHEAERPHKLIEAVSQGWPRVLSSLKSLLETGKGLPRIEAPPR